LDYRCAHRGTQLSTGWVEGDAIRCFYHGWKYDGSGQCIEQPAEDAGFCQKIRVGSYPVQEYLGLIFAYLGDGEPPELPRWPEFESGPTQAFSSMWPCNWFHAWENAADNVHGAFVHRPRMESYGLADVPVISGGETDYGLIQIATRKRHRRILHLFMPNIGFRTPWSPPKNQLEGDAGVAWNVPRDDEHVLWFGVDLLSQPDSKKVMTARPKTDDDWIKESEIAEQILAGELRFSDIADPDLATRANIEDYVAQVGQGVYAVRDEREHLGRSDVLLIQLRKVFQRELRALAEGGCLKQWHRNGPLEVSSYLDEAS
jgi:5,5'-dehydrodivanillate O-demethylase